MARPAGKNGCTAVSKRSGKLCDGHAMTGQDVCRMHGGSSPQARAAAERRQQEAEAQRAAVTYGLPREVDPHTALLEELWRTAGHVAWLRERVTELETSDLHGPVGASGYTESGTEHHPRDEAHIWVRLYQEERKHLASVARDCIRAGIEERRVDLEVRKATLIADLFRAVFDDPELGLTPAQRKRALPAAAKHLRIVAGGD